MSHKKQVQYWKLKNIRSHRTALSRQENLVPGICVPWRKPSVEYCSTRPLDDVSTSELA
jgi:hypothetical protein